ncbi:MAG: radical SAM protein [Cyanophyceae cyanobacterium]
MGKFPAMRSAIKPITNLIQERPILAVFEVCLRCNSQCQYCDLPLNKGHTEMTRSQIRQVFSSLYQEGLRVLFVQGGEPLLRRDLPEILEDLADLGFYLVLITNGTLLTAELSARFNGLPLQIAVSLDTLDRERYQKIRGRDQLPQVLRGIAALQNFSGFKSLVCIVSQVNQEDAIAVARFARERGFMPIMGAYHWDVGEYGKVSDELMYQKEAALAVFEAVLRSNLVPRGFFRDYVQDNLTWLSGKSLEPCDAGRYSIVIDSAGNVSPCLAHSSAGNLLESPLPKIVSRFNFEEIQTCSQRSSCNMLCSRVVGKNLRHPGLGLATLGSIQLRRSFN